MSPQFYLKNDYDGTVTGPHSTGTLKRKLDSGEMTWDSLISLKGSDEWVPATTHEEKLDIKRRPVDTAEPQPYYSRRRMRKMRKTRTVRLAWGIALGLFALGLTLAFLKRAPFCWVTAAGCLICGGVLIVNGAKRLGICALVFGALTIPLLLGLVLPR